MWPKLAQKLNFQFQFQGARVQLLYLSDDRYHDPMPELLHTYFLTATLRQKTMRIIATETPVETMSSALRAGPRCQ